MQSGMFNSGGPTDPAEFLKELPVSPNTDAAKDAQLAFASYRADAIARCVEQLRDDMKLHPEHPQLVAEALGYAWSLVQAGRWNIDQVRQLENRLKVNS